MFIYITELWIDCRDLSNKILNQPIQNGILQQPLQELNGCKLFSRKRSIMKAISWRVIASLTTFSIAYIFTNEIAIASGVGLVDAAIKLVAYYGFERIWLRVR